MLAPIYSFCRCQPAYKLRLAINNLQPHLSQQFWTVSNESWFKKPGRTNPVHWLTSDSSLESRPWMMHLSPTCLQTQSRNQAQSLHTPSKISAQLWYDMFLSVTIIGKFYLDLKMGVLTMKHHLFQFRREEVYNNLWFRGLHHSN